MAVFRWWFNGGKKFDSFSFFFRWWFNGCRRKLAVDIRFCGSDQRLPDVGGVPLARGGGHCSLQYVPNFQEENGVSLSGVFLMPFNCLQGGTCLF